MTQRILSCSAALAEALHEEMRRNETIFILGEDLVAHAGIFGQFKGLPEAFPGRIIDSPIFESCIAGCGVGAAMTGMRPARQCIGNWQDSLTYSTLRQISVSSRCHLLIIQYAFIHIDREQQLL